MPPYISTTLSPKLILASEPTIRIWLYLLIRSEKTPTITTTAKDLSDAMSRLRKTSRRAASKAINDLEALGMVSVRRVGRAMEIVVLRNSKGLAV